MKTAHEVSIPQSLDEVCDRRRIALLVYDMQVGIVDQLKNPERITQQVLKVVSAARDAEVRVFFSRHLSLPKELMGMFQYRMAMAWQRTDSPEAVTPWFLRDSPGFQITPELQPRPSEGVLDKLTMSAFEGTWLDFALRDCGINALIIVGVATEIGIEPTARHGADLGYIPVLVTDACGAGNEEAAKRSIESLKFAGDTVFTDTEKICAVLRQRAAVRSYKPQARRLRRRRKNRYNPNAATPSTTSTINPSARIL
jgi:nicotinamidase-related amidase